MRAIPRLLVGVIGLGCFLLGAAGCAAPPAAAASGGAGMAPAPASPRLDVVDVAALDVAPRPRFHVAPQYPFEMRRQGIEGEALVEFIIDEQGNVEDARAIRATSPSFGRAAAAAVSKWKFTPGRKNGQNVAVRMQVPLYFSLSQQPQAR